MRLCKSVIIEIQHFKTGLKKEKIIVLNKDIFHQLIKIRQHTRKGMIVFGNPSISRLLMLNDFTDNVELAIK